EVADLYRDWHPRVASVIDATDPDEITRHDVYDRPLAQRWVSGRVAVVGDAAHAMTPALGQGGAQALEDAVALARHLVSEQPAGATLLAFERDRKRRASSVAWLSRTSARLGQLGGRMARVRNAVARATPSRLFEAGFTLPF
ncbi:MAG: FAD-dependent monooxygenase, partial [Bacteroidota bacterium]